MRTYAINFHGVSLHGEYYLDTFTDLSIATIYTEHGDNITRLADWLDIEDAVQEYHDLTNHMPDWSEVSLECAL